MCKYKLNTHVFRFLNDVFYVVFLRIDLDANNISLRMRSTEILPKVCRIDQLRQYLVQLRDL